MRSGHLTTEEFPELSAPWARVALMVLLGLITYWLLVPSPPGRLTQFQTPLDIRTDWLLHCGVYGTVTFFLLSWNTSRNRISGFCWSLIHALGTELAQVGIPSRHFNASDLLANGSGLLLGGLLWVIYRGFVTRYYWAARLLSSASVVRLNSNQLG